MPALPPAGPGQSGAVQSLWRAHHHILVGEDGQADLYAALRWIADIDKHTFLDALDTAIGVLSDETVVLGSEHRSSTIHDME